MKTTAVAVGTFLLGACATTLGVYVFLITGSSPANETVHSAASLSATVANNNSSAAVNSAVVATNTNNNTTSVATQTPALPASYSLAVPFTVQAPNGIWDAPYDEACEEASMLMTGRFLQGRTIRDASDANDAILQLTAYVKQRGYAIDMTAEETAKVLAEFYEVKTEVVYDFTWDQIKTAIVAGHPVIIPAAGQQLKNPHFQTPGPRYHMLVVKGYNATQVITNDPGTKFGADYAYSYDVLFNASHDWNGGNVDSGRRVAIIVSPK